MISLKKGTKIFKCYPMRTTKPEDGGRQDIYGVSPAHHFSVYLTNTGFAVWAVLGGQEKWIDLTVPLSFSGRATFIAISWDINVGREMVVNGRWNARPGSYKQIDADGDFSRTEHLGYMQDVNKGNLYNDSAGPLELVYESGEHLEIFELMSLIDGYVKGSPPETEEEEVEALKQEISNLRDKLVNVTDKFLDLKKENERLSSHVDALTKLCDDIKMENDDLKAKNIRLYNRCVGYEADIKKRDAKITALEYNFTQLINRAKKCWWYKITRKCPVKKD